jgi:hypothetical protein
MVQRLLAAARRRPSLAAAALLLALSALFYAPLLLGLRTFPDGDFTHHFLPFSLFLRDALRDLRLPLWNPYTYGGHPFLADTQAAVFYWPADLLLLLTLPWGSAAARLYFLQAEAALHIALAGLFVFLLVRDLTHSRRAGLLAGIAFAFSCYLTGYPPVQLAVLRTAVWLPLLLWLTWRGAAQPGQARWWVGAALALATAFLAGHPQTFLITLYVLLPWLALLLWLAWRDGGWPGRAAVGMGGFLLLALGLSAAQWLPSVEFTRLSVRAGVGYDYVSGGFPLRDTWEILLPHAFSQYAPLYVGMPVLALAAVALARVRRPAERGLGAATLFFAVVAVIALLLAYGGNGFLYPIFYRIAPGWSLFRGQERAAFGFTLALSVLAGIGLVQARAGGLWRRRAAMLFGALVIASVYGFGLLWQMPGRTALGNGGYLLLALLTLAAAMGVALALWLPGWSTRREYLLVGLTAANLFLVNFGANLAPRSPANAVLLPPEAEALQAAVAERSEAANGIPGRAYNEFRVYEDYGMRAGVEDVWGSSPLRLARYAALFDTFPLDRMWRLAGVEHVLTWRKELFEPSTLLAEFPREADTTYLHRLPAPNPRAWIVPAVEIATDEEARAHLADHAYDLDAAALLPPESGAQAGSVTGTGGTVQLEQLAPGRLAVTVEGEGGLLIVAENWMPGWQIAALNASAENPAPVFGLPPFSVQRADLTFLGVPLPPGEHHFELVYRPRSVRLGLWISGLTLALLAAVGGTVLVVDRLWRRKGRT